MSDWIGLPENITEEHLSIIYKITNKTTLKSYVGKCQLWSTKKLPPLKSSGKTRKRKVTKPSNYLNYYGSSEELKKEVEQYGKDNYIREVLDIASCKWDAAYKELLYQIKYNVIQSDEFYNGILNVRLIKMPFKLRDSYKNLKVDIQFGHDTKELWK